MQQGMRWFVGLVTGLAASLAYGATILTTVDNTGDVGYHTSLQLNGGNPVIGYYDGTTSKLRLATCTANCQTATPTWVFSTVDSGVTAFFNSLQLNGGNPVISYLEAINGDLKLATCTANCQTATPTWVVTTVDSVGNVGAFDSLQLNAGNPVIAYSDTTNLTLKLATCTANCQTASPTWKITTVDNAGNVGAYASMQLNGGKPVISYYDATNGDLKLATCTAGCQTATPTWVITTVDSPGDVGYYTSLQLNSGDPVVSYFDSTGNNLKVATCTANCQTATPTWVITTAAAGANAGATSLQLNTGNPVVAYWEQTARDVKLATCTANCQSASPTWAVTTVDSVSDVGEFLSMQLLAGGPVISYRDGLAPSLKLAMTVPPPTVTSIVRAGADPTAASSVSFTVTFSEAVTGVDATDFALTTTGLTGASITTVSGTGTTWTVTVATGTGSGTLRLDVVDDDTIVGSAPLGGPGAGNGNFTTGQSYTVDRTSAVIATAIRSTDGNYVSSTGQAIDVTLTFDKAITVTGSPFIALTIGTTVRNATYVSGSGTTSLSFQYTVQASDQDFDGIDIANGITLNGGTLRDALGNDAALTPIPVAGHAAGILVNSDITPDPFTFTAVTGQPLSTVVTSNTVTIAGIDLPVAIGVTGGTYSIGCTATFTSAAGTIANGQTVCVRHTTSALPSTTVSIVLTVGSVSSTFSSTTAGAAVPGIPTIAAITGGPGKATIVFTAPASNGGSPITGYTATCSGGGGNVTATGAGSPLVVSGLTNGTTYSCSIVATNGVGSGPASTPLTVTPLDVPGAPTIVSGMTSSGGAQAILTFTPPAANGGSPITSYTATCTSASGSVRATGPASPLTVSGLGASVTYTCSVTATNAMGTGPASTSVTVTGLGLPSAPTIVDAALAGTTAQITFNVPASDGGLPITRYDATCTSGGSTVTASGPGSPILVAGIASSLVYNCKVTATNGVGTGPASNVMGIYSGVSPARVTMHLTMNSDMGCSLASAQLVAAPASSDIRFPVGVMQVSTNGCALGSTAKFKAQFVSDLASSLSIKASRIYVTNVTAGSREHGPPSAKATVQWQILPATITDDTVSFTVTDGALGDSDGAANGSIVVVGGPGFALVSDAQPVPTLSEWARMLLGLLVVAAGVWTMRRRR